MENLLKNLDLLKLRQMSYEQVREVMTSYGVEVNREDYESFINSSDEEIKRMMSLMNDASKETEIYNIEPTIDFKSEILRSSMETLRELAEKRNMYIGVSVDTIEKELKDKTIVDLLVKEFNSITITNSMKWNNSLKDKNGDIFDFDFEDIDKVFDTMDGKSIRKRGHTLIWGKFKGRTFPNEVYDLIENSSDKRKTLMDIIEKRISITMSHFKGKVHQWDVVNEATGYDNEFKFDGYFNEIMGPEYIEHAFKCAHAIDPNAELFINEAFGSTGGEKGKKYIEWLKSLLEKKVPIHGVGIQGHVLQGKYDIEGLKWFINELKKMGLKFEITEFDMGITPFRNCENPLESQGQQTYEILKAVIESGNCQGITFWGLSDRLNWYDSIPPYKNHAPNKPNIFDDSLNKKPMYYATKKVLL